MLALAELQKALIKFNLDAYIVTRNNMFLGQDILPEENKVRELCGFSGSAGNMIVFRDKAFLFVDGRYELQAQMEVDASDIAVVCTRESLATWMQNNLAEPCTIAYDPWCHSVSEVDYWNRSLKRHTFVEDGRRLLGSRLSAKECEIFEHDIRFAGISMDEKISYLTEFMQKSKLDAFFISECDAVSWLLNLRSDCLPDTPIIRAFALVDKSGEVSLFTNDFKKIEVELAAYKGLNIGLTYNQTPRQIQSIMKNHKIWMSNIPDPIQLWKAVKNPIEISGFKNAHRRDAVAVIKFLYWLEHNWQGCNELDVVRKLHEFRAAEELFYSNSFETIAAFGPDGAIVHYQPTPQTNRELTADSVLLLDSGAQYYDGTTDITRTIALCDEPSEQMKKDFTRALKGTIGIAKCKFPAGIRGCLIDAFARKALWDAGINYLHGTCHGIGHCLNVHEGPQSIRMEENPVILEPGMVMSDEPALYRPGEYGIRTENMVLIREDSETEFGKFLGFETLTLCYIDTKLVIPSMLSVREHAWLNKYHQMVYDLISPHLDEEEKAWLKEKTAEI